MAPHIPARFDENEENIRLPGRLKSKMATQAR
jgi:hypothetical protein